jgi:hypothetical protein
MEQFATVAVEATPMSSKSGQPALSNVTPEMDLFSLGCVLCELFAEDSLFDLSTLLVYRTKGVSRREMSRNENSQEPLDQIAGSPDSGKSNKSKDGKDSPIPDQVDGQGFPPSKVLHQIELPEIRELVKQMIDLRPDERGDCATHIHTMMENKVFPRFFEPLHRYLTGLNQLSADEKILKLHQDLNELSQIIVDESSSGLLLLINNVLPCLRSLKHIHAKITSVNLLLEIIRCNQDQDLVNHLILERTLPYFIDFIAKDSSAKVKAHTIKCLTEMLALIQFVPTSDKNVFLDYILPVLCKTVSDDSALVRMQLARDLPELSSIAIRYLNTYNLTCSSDSNDCKTQESSKTSSDLSSLHVDQSSPQHEQVDSSNKASIDEELKTENANEYTSIVSTYQNLSKYSSELKALQRAFQHITHYVLTDREISIRIELMLNPNLIQLCTFFGKQKTNEIIFSHLITFLNERSDFELRSAFFQCIVSIGCYLGTQSSPLLKPLLQQGFTDLEESVINQAINSTAHLAELQLIPKKTTIELLSDAMPLIVHPNLWIRHSLVRLITCCSSQLNLAELNCKLLPLIRFYLTAEQQEHLLYLSNTVSDTNLLMDNLVKPIPRTIFDLILYKITSSQQLDAFFETLEKRKMIRIASLTLPRTSGSTSSLASISSVTPSHAHQSNLANLNAANLIGMGSKGLMSSAVNSIVVANTNHLSYCAPTSLIPFFDLLIEEGLNDQTELNLIRMTELIKRLYRQIRAARCIVSSASPAVAQGKQSLSKPIWSMQSKGTTLMSISGDENAQIKRKNKRLFSIQLNEQSTRATNEAEWHITSSMSGESSTNDELQLNPDCSNSCSFEIAKEAKELCDGEFSTEDTNPLLPETSSVSFGARHLQSRVQSYGSVSCPPCVSDLNHLTRHKQYKYGESLGNGATLESCVSFASNITLATATPHSSNDFNAANSHSRTLARYARTTNGHYALSSFRPQGRLIANLFEHTAAITKLVSIDCGGAGKGTLFASCSLDGSIRLWDASKMNLGKNLINKSKQVFDLKSAKQSTSPCEVEAVNGMSYSYGRENLIAFSSSGDLYVIKVDGRSAKMSLGQRLSNFGANFSEPNEIAYTNNQKSTAQETQETDRTMDPATPTHNAVTDISSNSPFVFVCSFSNSNINAFDLRMPLTRPIWKFATQPNEGLITCITEGKCLKRKKSVIFKYKLIITFFRFCLNRRLFNFCGNLVRQNRRI